MDLWLFEAVTYVCRVDHSGLKKLFVLLVDITILECFVGFLIKDSQLFHELQLFKSIFVHFTMFSNQTLRLMVYSNINNRRLTIDTRSF